MRFLALRDSGSYASAECTADVDIAAHRAAILGKSPGGRDVRIMVTLPAEAGTNPTLVEEMLRAGMNVARINCAHDDADAWHDMIINVRQAATKSATECRIFMDLAGPKLHTGELEPGPRVIHFRPKRDPLGRIIAPRRIRLIPDDAIQHGSKSAVLSVPAECIDYAQVGDEFRLKDTRGKKRVLHVADKDNRGLVLESWKGAYIATGSRLRGHRGINFPKSDIRLPGLTANDRSNLPFVAAHADAVNLSFVRKPSDIALLQAEPEHYPDSKLGTVIKIETMKAYGNLPQLMLAAMRKYPAAIMIARGGLAVECGWERLAELQEDILSFCKAAGLPVIWATQVLEHEARKGLPSRAEITDAAASQRADCVMLNKGPHILAAIRMLDSILRRMQSRQSRLICAQQSGKM